jgi:hypothetical protein
VSLEIALGALLNATARIWIGTLSLGQPAPTHLAEPQARSAQAISRDMDDLVAAYPRALKGHDGAWLYWRDGSRTAIGPVTERPAATILERPGVADIFAWPYPLGPLPSVAKPMGDPGRARPASVFLKLYGDCRKGEVQKRLVAVPWVDGHTVRFTSAQGASQALAGVARDLQALGPAYRKYLWPTSGTFNCRTVAGSEGLSMHAYGAAIDLGSRFGGYWRWGPANASSTIPYRIVEVFERHGFIWGAKWAHFDSFHFEYRPELIRAARRASATSGSPGRT